MELAFLHLVDYAPFLNADFHLSSKVTIQHEFDKEYSNHRSKWFWQNTNSQFHYSGA
jgi:hypothetical protein